MKGMLDVARLRGGDGRADGGPDPLQHLLDPRVGGQPVHRPPRRGEAAQGRGPGADRRGRGLLGAVGQGRGVRALPVRRRRLRSGPDPPARRVPDLRLADGAGLLRVRGLLGAPADEARARVPGLGADLAGVQLRLRLLHRPVDARARGKPLAARDRRRDRGAGRRRRARGDPAGPEREQLRARPARASDGSASPSCWRPSTRSRESSGSATRARTPRTCART